MASTPSWPNLVQGNTGKNVSALQCLMNYRNNNTALAVDGSFGPALYNAVVAYQRSNGLTANGQAGQNTLSKLVATVQSGAVNSAARAAQYLLSKFESLAIDGSFGPGAVTAIKTFQQKMAISVDGSVGPTTWQYLFGYDSYPGGGGGGTSKILPIPGRNCCWNQFYTGITNITGSGACTITTALDLVNFYGPSSYTITDIKGAWVSGAGMNWNYNFAACGSKLRVKSSSEALKGSAAFQAIRAEIDAGHPVIVNIGTGNSDNHTVMCYGYTNGGTANSHFKVMDPAYWEDKSSQKGIDTTLDNSMSRNSHPEGIWCIRRTYPG